MNKPGVVAVRERGGFPPARRQRGSIMVMAALFASVAVILLASVDIGYQYYMRRDLQKVADLAALAGAQRMDLCDSTNKVNSAATGNAQANGFTAGRVGTVIKVWDLTCGSWSVVSPATTASFSAGALTDPVTGLLQPLNAVQTVATQTVQLPFYKLTMSATATASRNPIAVFSVGTTLARVNGNSIVGTLLGGVGVDLSNTSVIGMNGLATVNITPGGLLKALGIPVSSDITVGGLNALLNAQQVSVGDFLNAVAAVANTATPNSLATASIAALENDIGTGMVIPDGSAPLLQLGSPGGLFAQITGPGTASAQSALNAQVNALSLVSTGLAVATSKHALKIHTGINLGLATATIQSSIVEPPSIAIGGVGATAFTAQVRSYIHVTLNAVLFQLNLPIVIDVASAQATVTSLCNKWDPSHGPIANISAQSALVQMCVGTIDPSTLYSTTKSCSSTPSIATPTSLLTVTIPLVGSVNLPPNPPLPQPQNISALPASAASDFYALPPLTQTLPSTNPLAIGTTVNSLTTGLLTALLGSGGGVLTSAVNAIVLTPLTPVFNLLGSVILEPLLTNVVGVNLNQTDVTLLSLNCTSGDNVKLVN